jgi:hypothetical protein
MEIKEVGRWTYELSLHPGNDGLGLAMQGPRVFGLRRAERRARRDLRWLARIHGPRETVKVVTDGPR